jgi:UDP-GlcNAc3NAcA epimerase
VELVDSGWNRLAPPSVAKDILKVLQESLGSKGQQVKPYGDGKAAKKIVSALVKEL